MPAPATGHDVIRARIDGVEILNFHVIGTVAGVVPRQAAARNGPGQGLLRIGAGGGALTWQAPGSKLAGAEVAVTSDGDYLLEDGEDNSKWLRVEVHAAYLRTGEAAAVSLADRYANGPPGDDVTAAEALAGDVTTWTIDLLNEGDEALSELAVWLDSETERLEISADGSEWFAPTTEPAALSLGDLDAGEAATLYVRRTVAADETFNPRVLILLRVAWYQFVD
jgi:hypothetical protein